MDVSKDNFADVLVSFKKYLEERYNSVKLCNIFTLPSDFVAIDMEMTGVTSSPSMRPKFLESAEEYYHKIKDSAEKFAVTQVGVCTFKWDHENKRLHVLLRISPSRVVAAPFNFNIFPQYQGNLDRMFLSQPSSLLFLADNKFDFNKWIYKGTRASSYHNIFNMYLGIPFLSHAEDQKIRDNLENYIKSPSSMKEIVIENPADIKLVEDSWYHLSSCIHQSSKLVEEWLKNPNDKLQLPPCNSYHRRYFSSYIYNFS